MVWRKITKGGRTKRTKKLATTVESGARLTIVEACRERNSEANKANGGVEEVRGRGRRRRMAEYGWK